MKKTSNNRETFVFFVSTLGYPELPGGMMRIFRNAVILRKKSIRFIFLTEKRPGHIEDELLVDGVKTIRFEIPERLKGGDCRSFLLQEARTLWSNLGRPKSFVEMGIPGDWSTFRELVFARICGLRPVCGLTIMPEYSGSGIHDWKERIGVGIRFLAFWRILALSKEMKRGYLRRYSIANNLPIQVFPNGVDSDRFFPLKTKERDILRENFGISRTDRVILYVGSLVPRKRLRNIVGAWGAVLSRCPRAKLFIVGAEDIRVTFSSGEQKEEFDIEQSHLKNEIDRYQESGSIRVFDACEHPEKFYQMADLFVLPSELEGLPNVLLEAMSSGLPCIISDFVGRPRDGEEIGVEGLHYVGCIRDEKGWGSAICDAVENYELREKVGTRARELIEQEHCLSKRMNSLAAFYREQS